MGQGRLVCPSCTDDLECVSCYLDNQEMRQIEEDRTLSLEGWADDDYWEPVEIIAEPSTEDLDWDDDLDESEQA